MIAYLITAFKQYPEKDIKLKVPITDLKFFFMTVLWRASVSSMEFFKSVKLDNAIESYLHDLIWQEATGQDFEFPFLLERLLPSTHADVIHKVVLDPRPVMIDEMLFYKFVFGGYVIRVKSCLKKISPTSKLYERLTSTQIIIGNGGNFDDTKLATVIRKVLKETGD